MSELYPLRWAWWLGVLALGAPVLFLARDLPLPGLSAFGGGLLLVLFLRRDPRFSGLSVRSQLLFMAPFLLWGLFGLRPETLVQDFLGYLLIIAAAKILGPRTPRDALQLFLLAQLLLVGSAVIRLDPGYAVLFVVETWVSVSGLVLLYAARECEQISRKLASRLLILGLLFTLGILFLTVFYFLFLPRPRFTLFSAYLGGTRTGLSEEVDPGAVVALKEDPSVVFRIRWRKGPRPKRPYFRVYVYGRYRKGVWEALRGRGRRRTPPSGPRATFEVLPVAETSGLPVPGYPLSVRTVRGPRAFTGPEGTVLLREPVVEPSLWRIEAVLSGTFPVESPPERFLAVPENVKSFLAPLAKRLKRSTPLATVRAVMHFLRENYTYTVSPGRPRGDPLRWFLFESHRGHCEYFATAMVFLLRTLGLPARVVGGYAGGEWNPLGKYYLLRAKDAHTWVEVLIPGRGWVSFDPTPPAPGSLHRPSTFHRLRLLWDYLEFRWYYWVVEYDFLKQVRLLRGLSREAARFSLPKPSAFSLNGRAKDLIPATGLVLLGLLLFFVFLRRYRRRPPVERLLRDLEKRVGPRASSETLREYFSRISGQRPEISSFLERFLELYEREAFGEEDTRRAQEKLLARIRAALDNPPSLGFKIFK
ncbi:DUF3488 and transglutaminase-like domain-containing protein [Thermosulfurimonas sp. F29]|uniref:transglutaminase TgpA family protein n=1 Tax=Thermosulfurimonas sp. F29 TaxID=2867247 RepID=UPI001C82D2E3|nr:DUF3488 and transglutaminase-like domain-containing protein [Thermosulfurimonas sp. F29]MBX6423671.1 DUF3488 and transglutaminase-like domain-containing protein [Thermosulfurimonas sp. F29]